MYEFSQNYMRLAAGEQFTMLIASAARLLYGEHNKKACHAAVPA